MSQAYFYLKKITSGAQFMLVVTPDVLADLHDTSTAICCFESFDDPVLEYVSFAHLFNIVLKLLGRGNGELETG